MSLANAVTKPPARWTRRSILDGLLDTLPDTEADALNVMLRDPYNWPAQAVADALAEHANVTVSDSAVRNWRQRNLR